MVRQERIIPSHEVTKLSISRVGIGTWALGGGWGPQPEAQSFEALCTALDSGCTLIDTAPLYGNGRAERLVTQAFHACSSRVTTLTKISPLNYHWAPAPGTPFNDIYPPEHIIAQVEGSLCRLDTACLDCVMFQTWCPSWTQERRWYDTMRLLQEQGKIRTFGISVSDHRADEANGVIEAGLVDIIEVGYSILDQRAADLLFPLAHHHQVSIIARSPLASGALAGGWYEGMTFHRRDWRRRVFRGELLQQTLKRVSQIKALNDPGLPLAHLALRFCLSHPAVTTVIPGIRTADQAVCNLAVLEQDPLPETILNALAILWQEEFCHNIRTSIGEEGEG